MNIEKNFGFYRCTRTKDCTTVRNRLRNCLVVQQKNHRHGKTRHRGKTRRHRKTHGKTVYDVIYLYVHLT